jgi:putative transposase
VDALEAAGTAQTCARCQAPAGEGNWTAVITTCGRICYQRRKINVSQVFAGHTVGVKQVDDHLWLVTFMHYDLGYFDDETCRLEPIANDLRVPVASRWLPSSPIQ